MNSPNSHMYVSQTYYTKSKNRILFQNVTYCIAPISSGKGPNTGAKTSGPGGEGKKHVSLRFWSSPPQEDFSLMEREGAGEKRASFAEWRVKCLPQGDPEPGGQQRA